MQEPVIKVGIMSAKKIDFTFYGDFKYEKDNRPLSGIFSAELVNGSIVVRGVEKSYEFDDEVEFEPSLPDKEHFMLKDVVIGVNFHWERKEKQSFRGSLKLIKENGKLTAVNVIPIEEYLRSVISSEMSARSSNALLKAHAVISRGWLLAQIAKSESLKKSSNSYEHGYEREDERIKWYDREDHVNFDVCADDHCQRYQGITKIYSEAASRAVNETRGLVLKYDDEICDARFYKACGGITESFENVWEDKHYPYLVPVVDYKFQPDNFDTDFENEENARKWITSEPPAFCNTDNAKTLSQVLMHYDQETKDFYRWKVELSQDKIKKLIKEKSGIDFGDILNLIPVERGGSARLVKLKIVGSKKTMIIGKELEIRRILSDSHLYSSAIVIEKQNVQNDVPGKFILYGAGWGHGVGLCQIGAAVMAERGYHFDEILLHYYKDAVLEKIY